jgi:hypothetical protein
LSVLESYKLRWQRKRLIARAVLKRRDLMPVMDRTQDIRPGAILLMSTVRNERVRLPYFLQYYRNLGVDHFLIVENGSDDGTREYLQSQDDVSLWSTTASYKDARFGVDWLTALQRRHAQDHWCLTVDPDEFLVYPFCETRPLRALTDWLDDSQVRALSAMILDMYPEGPVTSATYVEGEDPFATAQWFDSGNYVISHNPKYRNLWIQGGPRARLMFSQNPKTAPALNKIPLVKWQKGYVYVSSTHMILPRGVNLVYADQGGEKVSGCLLHAKFMDSLAIKANEESIRAQHHADGREYQAYRKAGDDQSEMWCRWSERYVNWRQLEILGLMSKGNWA